MGSPRHAAMLSDALRSGESRDYQRAAELLITLLSETDEYPQAYLYLGRSFHALGRTERAIQFLHFFVEREPSVGAGHFFLGRSYAAEGLYAEAVKHLGTANVLDPDNPQILGMYGLANLKLRNTEAAVEILARAVELDPSNEELHSGYLNALVVEAIRRYRRGEHDLARQMLEFLVARGVATATTRLYLAHSYVKLRRYQEALEEFDHILEIAGDDPALALLRADVELKLGHADRAKATISEYQQPPADLDAPTLHRLMAIESFQQAKYRRAIDLAKSVIKHIGPDYEMHLLLGDAFRRLSVYDKAVNHFNRAISLDRHRLEPRYGIILANWQRGRFDEVLDACMAVLAFAEQDETAAYYAALAKSMLEYPADELLEELRYELERAGADPHLCTSIAEQHRRRGDLDEAERFFRKAIDLSQSHRPAFEGLFDVYRVLEVPERSADLYHAYFDLFPDDVSRRRDYIQILVVLRRYEHAVEQIQLQLPFDGGSEDLRRLQAFCYRELSRYRDAAILYRQLLKEHPDSDFYLRALAFCLERAGNRERAILLMERAFEYKPPDSSMQLILGSLLLRAKRLDEALEVFRTVIDTAPGERRAYASLSLIYRAKGMHEMADRFEDRAGRTRAQQEF